MCIRDRFTDIEKAKTYLFRQRYPIVIKASGLALGKGVIIAQTAEEALEALENIMVRKTLGKAGDEVVIEEFLTGIEISTHAFTDGEHFSMFPASQDHKKIGEGNIGLNTGGMGTIAPLPLATNEFMENIAKEIVTPTIKHMYDKKNKFQGILYPGLILTE